MFDSCVIRGKLLYLCLPVLILLSYSDSGFAYFNIEPEKKAIKIISPSTGTMALEDSHLLLTSDNDEYHGHYNSNIVNWPQSARRYFFSMTLPVTESLIQQREVFVPSDFSIENLIYANLKIARLVKEYHQLKERTRAVLKDLDTSNVIGPTGMETSLIKNYNNIYLRLNQIDTRLKDISSPLLDGSTIVEHGKNREFIAEGQKRLKQPSYNYSSGWHYQDSLNSKQRSAGSTDSKKKNQAAANRGRNRAPAPDDSFPWLERMGQGLLDYIRENIFEVICILAVLVGIRSMFFGNGKH